VVLKKEKAPMTLAEKIRTSPLLQTLRAHNPHKVRAYNGEDDAREIAVPQRRKKWGQVISAIEARAWSRVELLDKSGAILTYVENEGPARETEELGPSFNGVAGQLLLGERIAALCMKHVATAVGQRDEEMRALLQAQGSVVKEMATAVQSIAEVYREQTVAAEDAAESRAQAAAAAAGGDIQQLLAAMPQLLQLAAMAKQMLASGDGSPVVPNGVRKHS
jgi:hypothetical protein